MAAADGTIHRVDHANGEKLGSVTGQGALAFGLRKAGMQVFVLDRNGRVRALDLRGVEQWSRTIEEAGLAPLTPSPHGVLVPDGFGKLHLLSEEDGRELAVFDVGDTLRKGVTVHGDRAVLANGARELIVLDLVAQKLLLRRPVPAFASAAPSIVSGRILLPLADRSVLVFDVEQGRELLRLALGVRVESRVVGGSGVPVLLAGSTSRLLAYPDAQLR